MTVKIYQYTVTKNGEERTVKIVRRYKTKKDTSNTLYNKENREILVANITSRLTFINSLPKEKQIKFIADECLPQGCSASYNTLKKFYLEVLENVTQ